MTLVWPWMCFLNMLLSNNYCTSFPLNLIASYSRTFSCIQILVHLFRYISFHRFKLTWPYLKFNDDVIVTSDYVCLSVVSIYVYASFWRLEVLNWIWVQSLQWIDPHMEENRREQLYNYVRRPSNLYISYILH